MCFILIAIIKIGQNIFKSQDFVSETVSDIYTLAVDEDPPIPVSSRLSQTDQRQIGMSYGMLDEEGLPFEPVKLKTFSLCCN